MALSAFDQKLLDRCLSGQEHAWDEFVDRFVGLVLNVIDHTASAKNIALTEQDREDLAAEVFYHIVSDDFRLLRRFRKESSLATYLSVVARRVIVREMLRMNASRRGQVRQSEQQHHELHQGAGVTQAGSDAGMATHNGHPTTRWREDEFPFDVEELPSLLQRLADTEAQVVRLYYLDEKSYREISEETGMPENSVGPTLSRAREKLRRLAPST